MRSEQEIREDLRRWRNLPLNNATEKQIINTLEWVLESPKPDYNFDDQERNMNDIRRDTSMHHDYLMADAIIKIIDFLKEMKK